VEGLGPGVEGVALVALHPGAVVEAGPGVLAGVVFGGQRGDVAVVDGADGTLLAAGEAAVVPAAGAFVDFG
jgi:hypothetical protein